MLDYATIALLGVAIWIAIANRTRSRVSAEPNTSEAPIDSTPQPLAVRATDGRETVLRGGEAATPAVLMVFRTTCAACTVQRPQWLEMAQEARSAGLAAIGITSQELAGDVATYFGESPIEVTRVVDPATAWRTLHVSAVPATILVDARGRLRYHRIGVFTPAARDSVSRVLEDIAAEEKQARIERSNRDR